MSLCFKSPVAIVAIGSRRSNAAEPALRIPVSTALVSEEIIQKLATFTGEHTYTRDA